MISMSFARFSHSDVYVYEHYQGFIECCACLLEQDEEGNHWVSVELATPRKAIEHLEKHKESGHNIDTAIEQIEARYDDLDASIEKYETDSEKLDRIRTKIQANFREQDGE